MSAKPESVELLLRRRIHYYYRIPEVPNLSNAFCKCSCHINCNRTFLQAAKFKLFDWVHVRLCEWLIDKCLRLPGMDTGSGVSSQKCCINSSFTLLIIRSLQKCELACNSKSYQLKWLLCWYLCHLTHRMKPGSALLNNLFDSSSSISFHS